MKVLSELEKLKVVGGLTSETQNSVACVSNCKRYCPGTLTDSIKQNESIQAPQHLVPIGGKVEIK